MQCYYYAVCLDEFLFTSSWKMIQFAMIILKLGRFGQHYMYLAIHSDESDDRAFEDKMTGAHDS